jgi:hypothetical protein
MGAGTVNDGGGIAALALLLLLVGVEGVFSQVYPGFDMRLIVSPSAMLYSLMSLVSARTLPLKSNRWDSAGGGMGWLGSFMEVVARTCLRAAMVSVDATLTVNVAGGLADLTDNFINVAGSAPIRDGGREEGRALTGRRRRGGG